MHEVKVGQIWKWFSDDNESFEVSHVDESFATYVYLTTKITRTRPLDWWDNDAVLIKDVEEHEEELRSVSSTGAEKGVKSSRFSLLPMEALTEVASHYGVGATKYEDHNMRRGYEWSKSYDALMRHATQFWSGEDRDKETGSKHLAAVVFHALTLMEFMETHPEFDDRYKLEH